MSVKRKNPGKKKWIVRGGIGLALLAAVTAVGLTYARKKVNQQFGSQSKKEVETTQVAVGEIAATVSGSGTLADEEATEIVIPQSVDLTEVYVKEGQSVEAGEMLASVNSSSVVMAMAEVQNQLNTLDEDIADLTDDGTSETIQATSAGRVKKIYAAKGNLVSDVMYEHSALMLLSLDGKMAVDVETDELKSGDTVFVFTEAGKKYTGSVEKVWAGNATVTLTDNGPAVDAAVTVKTSDREIGNGTLYVHQPLTVTGYAGKVTAVNVSENASVAKGKSLLTISDTVNTVNYATLLTERKELEDTLCNLIKIYKEGAVYAKESGRITSYTESAAATGTAEAVDTTFALCPTDRMRLILDVDETEILSMKEGQEASITIEALGEDTYTGEVTDVNTVGISSDGVTTFEVEITLPRETGMLSGMSGSARITIEGKKDALLVQTDAIRQTRKSSFVYTSYDEESGEFGGIVEITTGMTNGQVTEILEGLAEGDTVYYQKEEENTVRRSSRRNSGNNYGGMGDMPGGGFPGERAPGSGKRNGTGTTGGNRS